MSFKRSVFGLGLLVLMGALSVSGARAGGYSLGISGGLGKGMSDFGDVYDPGYNLAGTVDYKMNMLFGAGVDLGYDSWNASAASELKLTGLALTDGMAIGTKIDDKFNAVRYGVHGTLAPPLVGPIHPYALVGVAGYALKNKAESTDPAYKGAYVGETSKSLFGWNAGAGVDFTMMPTLSFGVLGQFHDVASKSDFGSDATWFTVNGTLTFHVPLAQ